MTRWLALAPLALAAGCMPIATDSWFDVGPGASPVTVTDVVTLQCTDPSGWPFTFMGPESSAPPACKTPLLQNRGSK